jgi:hypothetical protein
MKSERARRPPDPQAQDAAQGRDGAKLFEVRPGIFKRGPVQPIMRWLPMRERKNYDDKRRGPGPGAEL